MFCRLPKGNARDRDKKTQMKLCGNNTKHTTHNTQENDVEFLSRDFTELSMQGNTFTHVSEILLFWYSANGVFLLCELEKKIFHTNKSVFCYDYCW